MGLQQENKMYYLTYEYYYLQAYHEYGQSGWRESTVEGYKTLKEAKEMVACLKEDTGKYRKFKILMEIDNEG